MREELGLPLEMPPFLGRIHPDFRQDRFMEAIFDCRGLLSQPSCEILLDSRNRVGKVELPLGENRSRTVVIKEFRTEGIDRLKSAVLPSKALKAWRGAGALYVKGLETPCPVAFLEKRKGLFVEQNFFISEMIEDVEEIRHLFLHLVSDKWEGLLTQLADYLTRCHSEGIHHRDISDGNILVKVVGDNYTFYLIDTNRIKLKREIGVLRRVKSLIRLGIPREFQEYFLEQYFKTARLKKFIWFWYRFNKVCYTGYIELKNRLHLRKISHKLKIQ